MFHHEDYECKSSQSLKEHFNRYCDWCWYHGTGNCDICKRLKNKALLKLKLQEFKGNRV